MPEFGAEKASALLWDVHLVFCNFEGSRSKVTCPSPNTGTHQTPFKMLASLFASHDKSVGTSDLWADWP